MRLQELVDLEALGLQVRACASGLTRRIVWVHTTELRDPTHYLSGGELILTTGVWRHRRADSERFVSALARAGVAGLCYGLPRPTARACPRDLVEACEGHRLPLLEASYDLPFIAIERAVVESFAKEREESLRSVINRNDTLLRAVVGGGGAGAILSLLTEVTGAPAWLILPGGHLAAATAPWPAGERPIDLWRRVREARTSAAPATVAGRDVTVYILASLGGEPSYLVHGRDHSALSIEERSAVGQALAFLGLEIAHRQVLTVTERRLAAHLLRLVDAGQADETEIATRLHALGVDTRGPLGAFVLGAQPATDTEVDVQADVLRGYLAGNGVSAVVARTARDTVACVFGWNDGEPGLLKLARGALDALDDVCDEAAIGVGALADDISSLHPSLVQARHARRVAARRSAGARIVSSREIDTSGLLLDLHDRELRAAFASAVLGPLERHDERHGTDLLSTVARFLDSGGRWEPTARELGVHVNTLRNRLARVESLTGRDLASTEDRVDLHLALRVRRVCGGLRDRTARSAVQRG
ncbi:MAG TPA: PucR family transcriptional regulator [Solirubrobacteraceae bacterium]|nr:PucR family transcriptional regulator [Solirubrobacteraceae bacterium]